MVLTCCKEVYRFSHNPYPYSTCISSFLQQHPYTSLFILKMVFLSFVYRILKWFCSYARTASAQTATWQMRCAKPATPLLVLISSMQLLWVHSCPQELIINRLSDGNRRVERVGTFLPHSTRCQFHVGRVEHQLHTHPRSNACEY